jgi:SAM-dependent methyltransferase
VVNRTRHDRHDLPTAWESHAGQWIAWAREPGHDSYWRFHRDQFLELVPPPGRATLDLGCGEGRLSRDLHALGHRVTGVDLSPTMVAAAAAAEPSIPVDLADATQLPYEDGAFDCVLAFMSLQDVENLDAAVREASRVLEPGGHFVLAVVHPINSAGQFAGDDADAPFVIGGSYLASSYYADAIERDGLEMTFTSKHRPLSHYVNAVADAGLRIEHLHEPPLTDGAAVLPRGRRWQRVPLFLHLRAAKS